MRHLLWLLSAAALACNAITGVSGYTNVDDAASTPDKDSSASEAGTDAGPKGDGAACTSSGCLGAASSCGLACEQTLQSCHAQCSNPGCINKCDTTGTACIKTCNDACLNCGCSATVCDQAVGAGVADAGGD